MTNAEARFNKSHIRKVYACLTVTCHLHFWQNDRDFATLRPDKVICAELYAYATRQSCLADACLLCEPSLITVSEHRIWLS